ncbi:MAG: acyl carrier protein [Planctomycetota bacterium]
MEIEQDRQAAKSVADVQLWLVTYVAEILKLPAADIDATVPFERYGIDSSAAVGMTGDLEQWLGFDLDPTVAYDHPTINELAAHLAELSTTGGVA